MQGKSSIRVGTQLWRLKFRSRSMHADAQQFPLEVLSVRYENKGPAQSAWKRAVAQYSGTFAIYSASWASVLSQKRLYTECHSGLDPESSLFRWIPVFMGMTTLIIIVKKF